jgi:linoleoyl-CoA desaturase
VESSRPHKPEKSALRPAIRPKFTPDTQFFSETRKRVDEYFARTGYSQQDCPQMYVKSAILLVVFGVSYALLVFAARTWWQAIPAAILLGLSAATIGLNIQHDGIHRAYSRHKLVNRIAALTLDMLGASSYFYTGKHVVFHHSFTNIEGADTDIDLGFLGRMAPEQRRFGFHRFQQYYLWLLYGFMVVEWHFVTDFKALLMGRISRHPFPRPKGWDLLGVLGGKAFFFALAFGIPLLVHPFWTVALFYAISTIVLGISLAVVFQLAHCVEEAQFPMPDERTNRIDRPWAIHQIETTVDFARGSKTVAWLMGGLNFQVEHHLFPRVCHIHYPAISKIVDDACREFGVRHSAHRTFRAGLASHYRFLKTMGKPAPVHMG